MRVEANDRRAGFTLIEVVLVLAIGGLIFLLAFIAFQQVSTNRRDTQRRSDAGLIISQLQNYIADGGRVTSFRAVTFWRGSSPDSAPADACGSDADPFIANFTSKYLCTDGQFRSPQGANYRVQTAGQPMALPGDFSFMASGCTDLSNTSKMHVRMKLENGEVCREL